PALGRRSRTARLPPGTPDPRAASHRPAVATDRVSFAQPGYRLDQRVRVGPLPSIEEARSFLREGRGSGVKVAVLDSGIEAAHPVLGGLALADDIAITDQDFQIKIIPGNQR